MPVIKIDKEELRNIESVFSSYTASLEDAAVKTQKASSTLSKMGLSVKPTTLKILTNLNRTKFEEQVASLQMIIEAFDNQDAELKKEAEKILGTENYTKFALGQGVYTDENGQVMNYVSVQEYLATVPFLSQRYGNSGTTDLDSKKQKGQIGQCTTVAPAQLLERRMKLDGTSIDLSNQNPAPPQSDLTDWVWRLDKEHGKKGGKNHYPDTNTVFTTDENISYTYTNVEGTKNTERMILLLNEHPEGAVIYEHYSHQKVQNKDGTVSYISGDHAIVISRYEYDETKKKYQFYAYDGVHMEGSPDEEKKLEETWLWKVMTEGERNSFFSMPKYVKVLERKN